METLCLRLYEHNGVELQTAFWYTIARMHTTGLSGLNEGLALIAALTRHHWSVMWPLNTHSRLEIITGLFNRLQKRSGPCLRTTVTTCPSCIRPKHS